MGSTMKERGELQTFTHEQHAGALWCIHLVTGEGEEVDALELLGQIEGELARGLHGIGVKECTTRLGDAGQLTDRLDDSRFVVGEHEGDQAGVRAQRGLQGVGTQKTAGVRLEIRHLNTASFEGLRGIQHGMVLDGRGDEVNRLLAAGLRVQKGL